MGVITTPFLDYSSCAMVLVDQWTSDGEKKNNTRSFSSVVSGWTKSNKGVPFLELVLPSNSTCFCMGVASQKFRRDYFSRFGWCSRKPRNLITLRNLYPYSIHCPSNRVGSDDFFQYLVKIVSLHELYQCYIYMLLSITVVSKSDTVN